jgi:uncharacterized protein YcbK (DUF882 family)
MRYFKYEEFDSPDLEGSGEKMSPKLLSILDAIREIYGSPIHITSGFRTKEANKEAGGKRNSSHLKGFAADLAVTDSSSRFKLINAIRLAGVGRIGIGSNFIHIDVDPSKPKNVIWTY